MFERRPAVQAGQSSIQESDKQERNQIASVQKIEGCSPQRSWEQRQTNLEIVATIDRLLDHHPYPEIAAKLNEEGSRSGEGLPFTARIVPAFREVTGSPRAMIVSGKPAC